MSDPFLGRLSPEAFAFMRLLRAQTVAERIDALIIAGAGGTMLLAAVVVAGLLTWKRGWRTLWTQWLTSTDHKRIGVMYVVLGLMMLARGLVEAGLLRAQQAFGLGGGFLSPDHVSQLFSTHGTTMIFFVAMPLLTGLINFVVPLQIGARDVAFPTLNLASLGLTVAGFLLMNVSLIVGEFSTGGWTAYPNFTEAAYQPGVGPDVWIWSVTLASLASTFTAVNFIATIYKLRAPGMRMMHLPMFTWTALCTATLMLFAMPPLTVATSMLALDRYLGFQFFTAGVGQPMLFANLFWLFGHPEVYILILPAFGVFSEVFSTFSGKRLYGYGSLVVATVAISVLSYGVWVHHFFTMGQSADLNAAFGIATMVIGLPTGVKVYDWLLTMWRGRVRLTPPMIYALGFAMLFVLGGLSGIILANPSLDYQTHNTLFLVAHFHNMLVPGTLFGMLAGYELWFPKAFGFRLDAFWGRVAAVGWVVGFVLAFAPLYVLGLLGMPRRMVSYAEPSWQPYTAVALVGWGIVMLACSALVVELFMSVRRREANAVPAGDPWDGAGLEWAVSAPPPPYNFAVEPTVEERDVFLAWKRRGTAYARPEAYADVELPVRTAVGVEVALAGFLLAFGLVWRIPWLEVLALAGGLSVLVAHALRPAEPERLDADEVRRRHEAWLDAVAREQRVTRALETSSANRGLATGGWGAQP